MFFQVNINSVAAVSAIPYLELGNSTIFMFIVHGLRIKPRYDSHCGRKHQNVPKRISSDGHLPHLEPSLGAVVDDRVLRPHLLPRVSCPCLSTGCQTHWPCQPYIAP